ncbi:MAG: hypothetical protein U0264_16155 [Candidatus Kapaibacterium sp.]
MRHFLTLSVFVLAALLGACGDNTTTPTTTTGEIFGHSGLANEYWVPMTDNSGITGQLIEDGNVVQTVTTLADGSFSFKNVQAGVYGFRFFKQGYTSNTNDFRKLVDTASTYNFQFVGRGKYDLGRYWRSSFIATTTPDSSYYLIKPDIRYEVIKNIQPVDKVWLKDTTIRYNYSPDSSHYSTDYISIYGIGTSETRKIRCTIEFERALPFPTMTRTVTINNKTLTVAANELSTVYEFTSPNIIVKDSLGRMITSTRNGTACSKIDQQTVVLQATTAIPKGLRNWNDPQKISKTNELKVSLTD